LLDREREGEFFAEGDVLDGAGLEGCAGWRVSGATGAAGVQIPILVCGTVIHFTVGPADAPSSLWTSKALCASGR